MISTFHAYWIFFFNNLALQAMHVFYFEVHDKESKANGYLNGILRGKRELQNNNDPLRVV